MDQHHGPYGDYLERLTFLIFLKMADEYGRPPYKRQVGVPARFSWVSSKTVDYVLANPPFGRRSSMRFTNEEGEQEKDDLTYNRQNFWATTSNTSRPASRVSVPSPPPSTAAAGNARKNSRNDRGRRHNDRRRYLRYLRFGERREAAGRGFLAVERSRNSPILVARPPPVELPWCEASRQRSHWKSNRWNGADGSPISDDVRHCPPQPGHSRASSPETRIQ